MKKFAFLFTSLAALALTGCASTLEQRSTTAIDTQYIGAVEHNARSGGVQVQWVNPPRRALQSEEG